MDTEATTNMMIVVTNIALVLIGAVTIIIAVRDAHRHDEKEEETLERIARAAIKAEHEAQEELKEDKASRS